MEIITQVEVKVNTDFDNLANIVSASGEMGLKWTQKKLRAKEISAKMMKIGEVPRALRMANCGEIISGGVCADCGHLSVKYANLCRDRLCPVCTWRLSMRRFANMYTIVQGLRCAYPEAGWGFVTLTAKNCKPEKLKMMLNCMFYTWNCIASSKKFKERVAGWARSLEITYNQKTNTLHPHFHILVMYPEGTCGDLEYITRRWVKTIPWYANENGQNVEIILEAGGESEIGWKVDDNPEDDATVDAILETYKYSIKDKDIGDMPLSTFRDTVEAIKGRRLVAFGGTVKEYARESQMLDMDDANDEDESQIESRLSKCYKCGGKQIIDVVGKWAGSGYLWRREQ